MLSRIILLIIALVSVEARAFHIVKIISEDLATGKTMQGSGLGFGRGEDGLILTSDHVFYHSESGVSNRLQYKSRTENGFQIEAVDWGSGLGLLSVVRWAYDDSDLFNLRFCRDEERKNVSLQGYPANGSGLLIDDSARYVETISAREYFVEVDELDVYESGHAEFGMSGGAAVGPGGCIAGIISHQKVENGVNRILVIPADVVKRWLKRWIDVEIYSQGRFEPRYFEPIESQRSRRKTIIHDGTRYAWREGGVFVGPSKRFILCESDPVEFFRAQKGCTSSQEAGQSQVKGESSAAE